MVPNIHRGVPADPPPGECARRDQRWEDPESLQHDVVQSIFAFLTTVAVGTPGKAVPASATNFVCSAFNSAAVGVFVAAEIADTAVELLVDAVETGMAEKLATFTVTGATSSGLHGYYLT